MPMLTRFPLRSHPQARGGRGETAQALPGPSARGPMLAGLLALAVAAPLAAQPAPAASAPATTPVTAAPAPAPATSAATRAPMDFRQLLDLLTARGYHDVREMERKSERLVEVSLRERDGTRVELLLDARSGEVLRRKLDD